MMDDTQIRIDLSRYNDLYNENRQLRAENESLRETLRNLYKELMRVANETNSDLKF